MTRKVIRDEIIFAVVPVLLSAIAIWLALGRSFTLASAD